MGASATVSISGVSAASASDWAWWGAAKAAAGTYTFTGSAIADAVAAPAPLTVGPAAKFAVPLRPIVFTPLNLSAAGALGSTASASAVGRSISGLAWSSVDVFVSAATSAAGGGGTATASMTATDPWHVTFNHRPGHKSYVLLSLTPEFSLSPARGAAATRLFGSFGEIALSLTGANKPKAGVTLNKGWEIYLDVHMSAVGSVFRRPKRKITGSQLAKLFLKERDPKAPFWVTGKPITLTFVKEVPHSVASETVEAGIAVNDDDASVSREQRPPRGRG
jgi:hypothetical protein